jgi:PAS domain S-box-containing protein
MQKADTVPVKSGAFARILWAVSGATLMVLAMTGLSVWQDWRESVARVEERALAQTAVTEEYVLRRLRESAFGMKAMAELFRGNHANAAAIREVGELHRRDFPFIEAITVVDRQRPDVIVGEATVAMALRAWSLEQDASEGKLLVGRPLLATTGAMPVIPLLIRFRGEQGHLDTLAAAAIRTDVLSMMHTALRLDKNTVSVLVNEQGVLLSRHPYAASAIGRDIASYYPPGTLPIDRTPVVARFSSPIDGRHYMRGTIHLKDYPLLIRGGEEWAGAIAPWRERTERSVAIAATLIGAIAILGWLAMQMTKAEQKAQLAQHERDQMYRNTLATLAEGVMTSGLDGSIRTFNEAALRILGLTGDQLRGLTALDPRWRARREDGSDFPGHEHPVMQVLATGQPQVGVLMDLETGKGSRRWIEINAVPTYAQGVLSGAVVSFSDVTAHRSTLAQLETLNHMLEARVAERTAQLQRLGGELADVEDRERRQISRDLHDDIAQTLAAARIRLAGLAGESGEEVRGVARAVGALIDQADASIRSLAARLAPPALAEIGLVAGLEWLADEMERLYGLAVTVDDDHRPKPLTEGARTILFRAVRELLINVSKHAGVTRAQVECRCEGDNVVIEVADSGAGFDPQLPTASNAQGLGLRSVRERLHYIGGSLTWAARSGAGSRAIVVAPLARSASPVTESAT